MQISFLTSISISDELMLILFTRDGCASMTLFLCGPNGQCGSCERGLPAREG